MDYNPTENRTTMPGRDSDVVRFPLNPPGNPGVRLD